MLRGILEGPRRDVLRDLRQLLGELRVVLVRIGVPDEDQKALARSITQLDELFLLVVVGEFNAGKSAVINALLGERVLEEGVTPTTSRIGLLKHGAERGRTPAGGDFEEITLPLEILREMNVVDTPGTNAVLRGHEALTRDFVPRADLVLFVTSADRPFTESERAFLEAIRSWGKKVVVVVNKTDILDRPEDVRKVVEFLREQMRALLGLKPEVFSVSAKRAFRAKAAGVASDPGGAGFGALETYLTKTLDDAERVRLKLESPLGVGSRALDHAAAVVGEEQAAVEQDKASLVEIDTRLAAHREEVTRDFRPRLLDLEKPVAELARRGEAFLEQSTGFLPALTEPARVRSGYERDVAGPLWPGIEKRVEGLVEALSASEARLWPIVSEALKRRQARHAARRPGVIEPRPPDHAKRVLTLRREAQRALEAFDARAEARRLADAARTTAVGMILLILGAVALGVAAVAALRGTVAVAAGGAAGLLFAAALLLLPGFRRKEQARLAAWTGGLGQKLTSGLRAGLERELDTTRQSVTEAVAPLARFVRTEEERLKAQQQELASLRKGRDALQRRIETLR
jgi:small GTP-binding protein